MLMDYALDQTSGTYKFYDPTTDAIIVSNSERWRDLKPWEAENPEEAIRNLKLTTLVKMKDISIPSEEIEIILEHNVVNETAEEQTPTVQIVISASPPAQSYGCWRRFYKVK